MTTLLDTDLLEKRWRFIFSVIQHEVIARDSIGREANVTVLLEDYGFELTPESTLALRNKLLAFFIPWLHEGSIISRAGSCRLDSDGVYVYILKDSASPEEEAPEMAYA